VRDNNRLLQAKQRTRQCRHPCVTAKLLQTTTWPIKGPGRGQISTWQTHTPLLVRCGGLSRLDSRQASDSLLTGLMLPPRTNLHLSLSACHVLDNCSSYRARTLARVFCSNLLCSAPLPFLYLSPFDLVGGPHVQIDWILTFVCTD